ncbi:hypothetical protein Scep_003483 [Stephania cephalantha]|uniref:Uncharacterized protein n=1 Tax=Stephania cephalantha TaxID=152367 RepID=A0AAP0PWD3_9MAGN
MCHRLRNATFISAPLNRRHHHNTYLLRSPNKTRSAHSLRHFFTISSRLLSSSLFRVVVSRVWCCKKSCGAAAAEMGRLECSTRSDDVVVGDSELLEEKRSAIRNAGPEKFQIKFSVLSLVSEHTSKMEARLDKMEALMDRIEKEVKKISAIEASIEKLRSEVKMTIRGLAQRLDEQLLHHCGIASWSCTKVSDPSDLVLFEGFPTFGEPEPHPSITQVLDQFQHFFIQCNNLPRSLCRRLAKFNSQFHLFTM